MNVSHNFSPDSEKFVCNKLVVLYVRVLGKFSYFFYEKFLHTKKSIENKWNKAPSF